MLVNTRRVAVTLKRRWCLWCWCWEAGLLAVQCGPVVVELQTSRD